MYQSKIKTFEDACAHKGYDPATVLPEFSGYPEEHRPGLIAASKMYIVADAINDEAQPGVKFDWMNRSQYKWYPWFDMSDEEAASGFSLLAAFFDYSISHVGSRLCYVSEEAAMYAGQQFIDLYRDMFVKQ